AHPAPVDARPRAGTGRAGLSTGDPGLRLRPGHTRTGAAETLPELARAAHLRCQPGPRHVVAPRCGYERVAALRPGLTFRPGRSWPGTGPGVQPGDGTGGDHRPGRHDPDPGVIITCPTHCVHRRRTSRALARPAPCASTRFGTRGAAPGT